MDLKKIFSFVIALTVLVTNLSCLIVVNAADKLQITVDKVEAAAGENAVVNIKLTNNTGINSLLMDLHYGDLEFVKASFPIFDADDEGMMRSSNNKADEKRLRLSWISNTNSITGDVTYATVTFKVPEGAANGTKYELTADIDPENVFDKDGKNIDFDFVAGEVKVPGDPEVVDTYKLHSLDIVYAGSTLVKSADGTTDLDKASMKKGSVVTILGWAVFSDNLKEMFYTVDGEEQACENVYRDRTEIAGIIGQPAEYCVHAGFGLDNNLMDLLGTDSLDIGTYEISIGARANGGSEKILKTFTLEVVEETELVFVQSQSINTLWIDGEMIDGIGQTYITNNPITGDLKNLGVRGWAWIGDGTISQFGYKLDNGVEIFNDSFTQDRPDVQNVFGVTADVANGYSINPIDVSQLENGSHTVTVLVRTPSGTVIEVVTVPFSIERPEEPPYDPELSVAGCNLSFESSIYIKYAVKCNDLSKVKLLIWTEPQTQYEYGSQNYVLEAVGTEKVSGVKCAIFQYDKLAAKQMGDVIYARAVVENEGEYYYSNLKKYSVLQYVYNKTGRTGTASSNQKLIDLLNAMLDYGAKAQIYFNYKTDRLVTSDYYQISVVGGSLPDGCTSGLYALGEALTLTAPSANENGDAFSYWENDAGEVVGTTESITVTVVSLNRTYTAMYGAQIPDEPSEPEYSSGLAYSDNGDGTCTITGIGTCTDTVVDIPSEIDGLTVNAIGEKAFENQTSLTGINLPDTIKTIGRRAFYGCTGLTEFTIPNSVTSIGTQIFYKADNIETVYYNSDYYPSTETENQFLNNSSIKKIFFGGTRIGSYAARNLGFAGNVNTVEISNSVWSIGGSAFEGCTSLTSITIPDSVTSIRSDAFKDCTSLASITIPDGVKSIEPYTFSGCTSLANITIPGSVTSIGYYVFNDCTSLADVYYNGTIEKWLKISLDSDFSNPCCNGANMYIGGKLLTDAIIPDSVTGISGYAFYGCSSLASVTIPDSVTITGYAAFYGCTNMTSITIPDSVTSIGGYTFYGCTNLTSISIPNSVTSIGNGAFFGCTGLTSITIPDSVTNIEENTFYGCASLTSISIPASVTSIGGSAFYGCKSLTDVCYTGTSEQWNSITISGGNEYLTNATLHCLGDEEPSDPEDSSGLAYSDNGDGTCTITGIGTYFGNVVDIPSEINGLTVNAIGEKAFENQTSLTGINLPDTIKTIGRRAFYGCTGLTEFTIPNSVTSIGTQIFYKADNIETVYYNSDYYPSTETENQFLNNSSIKKIVFGGTVIEPYAARNLGITNNVESVRIADSVLRVGSYTFSGCIGLLTASVGDGATAIDKETFFACKNLANIELGSKITRIGEKAFYNCVNLKDMVLPDCLVSIGKFAFNENTSLRSLTIPDSVIEIDDYAFYRSGLNNIVLGKNIETIGKYAFYCHINKVVYRNTLDKWLNLQFDSSSNPCSFGAELYIDGVLITSLTIPDNRSGVNNYSLQGCISLIELIIPDSITSIGLASFDHCTNLRSVTIPDSVTTFGDSSFSECNSLTDIYYTGTIEQWNSISKSGSWNYRSTGYTVHCLNGDTKP